MKAEKWETAGRMETARLTICEREGTFDLIEIGDQVG